MINIAGNIQKLRKEKGMTQDDLADYLNLTKATISKWENQLSYPDIKYLPLLANLFDVTIDELIGHYPYLSKKSIIQLHKELVTRSNAQNFKEIVNEIEGLFKTYTNDYPTVLMLAKVLANNCFLLKDDQAYVINLAISYLDNVIEQSNRQNLVQEALFIKAACLFKKQEYKSVIQLLKDRPYKLGEELLLANSYILMNENNEAAKVIQVELYQQVILIINHLNMMLQYQLTNDINAVITRGEALVDHFNMRQLHPNTALNFYLISAKCTAESNSEESLRHLKLYYQCCKEFIENYYLHGDGFFDAIDDWLMETSTGIIAPVDKDNIKTVFIDVIYQIPEFKVLEHHQNFKNICYQLQKLI